MDSVLVDLLKEEEKCESECELNASVSTEADPRNVPPERMSPLLPVITAVYSVVFVVGLVGNCLVMYVIIR